MIPRILLHGCTRDAQASYRAELNKRLKCKEHSSTLTRHKYNAGHRAVADLDATGTGTADFGLTYGSTAYDCEEEEEQGPRQVICNCELCAGQILSPARSLTPSP